MSIELAGVIIALVIGGLSWWASHRAKELANESVKISAASMATNRFDQLRNWASEAITAFADAEYEPSPAVNARHKARLSALIDQGRFFLPNTGGDTDDPTKPAAYRGSRHAALDPLVAAIRVLDDELKGSIGHKDALWSLRREFVSRIQRILSPDEFNFEIAAHLRRAGRDTDDNPTVGGLLTDGEAPGATALIERLRSLAASAGEA